MDEQGVSKKELAFQVKSDMDKIILAMDAVLAVLREIYSGPINTPAIDRMNTAAHHVKKAREHVCVRYPDEKSEEASETDEG